MRRTSEYGKLPLMDFEKFLKLEAKRIEEVEQEHLKIWYAWLSKKVPSLNSHARAFIAACKGGKKIRGALINLGYKIAGGNLKAILDIAASYEIFHTSILAHDDVIDKSPTRRGKPSLYKRVGVDQAITLADAGFFLATKIISEANFPDKEKNEVLALFSKTMLDTAIGQMLDIAKGDALTIMKLKTAQYTISAPLQLGALLAGADEKSIRKLGVFGESLGIAFQIRDDILDGEVEVLEESEKAALKYKDQAKKIIPSLTKDPKMNTLLNQLAEYLVERKK